jgi:O-antigen/teichoic acid export membrane protein
MKNSHIKKFIHGSAIVLFVNIAAGALNYFVRRTLALNLSIVDFGFLYATMSLSMLFLSYIDLGFSNSATILIAKEYNNNNNKNANSYFNFTFYIKLVISFLIFSFIAITYKFWLYDYLKYDYPLPFFLICSLIIINAISHTPNSVFTALQKFFLQGFPNILTPILILIILYSCGKGNINVVALAFPVSSLLIFLISLTLVYMNGFTISFKALQNIEIAKNLFHFSKWVAISTAGFYTLFYMDSLMLTWLSGLKAVGIYNAVLPIVQIALSLLVFTTVFTPIATGLWVKNEVNEIANICNFMTLLSYYLLSPLIISIIYLSKPLIIILFSDTYASGANALVLLFSGIVFLGLSHFYASVLNTGNEEKKVALLLILATCANIILNLVFIPFLNITGAALATSVTYMALSFLLYIKLKKKLKSLNFPVFKILYFAIIGILCILFSIYLNNNNYNIFYCILYLILTLLLYSILTFPFLLNITKIFFSTLINR